MGHELDHCETDSVVRGHKESSWRTWGKPTADSIVFIWIGWTNIQQKGQDSTDVVMKNSPFIFILPVYF